MTRTLSALISLFTCALATQAQAQTATQLPLHLDPATVSISKELPRGDVTSHDTREEAIRKGYHASKYLQPLSEWTQEETADAVVWKARYKIPFGWIDRQQFLYLGRVSGSFEVTINGTRAGYSQSGSTPSEFDITKVSHEGNNDLEIVIYRQTAAQKLENSRPIPAPAIEGETYILSQPQVRVRDIFVDTRMEGTSGLLNLGVITKSHRLNPRDYTIYYELLSPKGEILAEGHRDTRIDMRREDTVRFFANIRNIIPWSHEEPRLYTLLIKTQNEGRFREYLSFQIGFHSLELQDGLVLLNGTPLKLEMRDFTPTADMTAMRTEVEQLRTEGVNALRLHGAPPSREFYSLCDELGVYLSAQADIDTHRSGLSRKIGGNPSNQPVWEAAYLDRVMAIYHTSKNSPSMVMFSLAENSANGYNLYESYLALKRAEASRPVLYTDGGEWNTDRLDTAAMAAIHYRTDDGWALVTPENVSQGRFRVHNTRHFTPIIGEAAYKIAVGNKIVSSGSVPLEVLPKGAKDFTIPITGVKAGKKFVVQIEVRIERPINKFVLEGRLRERRLFRDPNPGLAGIAEGDKIVIDRRDFPSER